jgi:hypothetical protein
MEINQQKSIRPKMKGHKLVRSLKQNSITITNKQAFWCMLFYTIHAIPTTETILH